MSESEPSRNTCDDPEDKTIDLTTEKGKQLVDAFGGMLKKLAWLRGEDCLLGNILILRTMHFLTCVRVEYKDGEGYVGTRDPEGRLDDVLRMAHDGGPETVELPGFEGEWVICIDPFRG